jgi:hypothetical protein
MSEWRCFLPRPLHRGDLIAWLVIAAIVVGLCCAAHAETLMTVSHIGTISVVKNLTPKECEKLRIAATYNECLAAADKHTKCEGEGPGQVCTSNVFCFIKDSDIERAVCLK